MTDFGDLVRPETPRRTAWTAASLIAACFPEPKWAVPNLIPAGCTCLAGPPKVGKSWMVLGLAVVVATGGKASTTSWSLLDPCCISRWRIPLSGCKAASRI